MPLPSAKWKNRIFEKNINSGFFLILTKNMKCAQTFRVYSLTDLKLILA